MGGTILITGGAGFIGSNLIGRLLERPENKNTKITCIDNFDSYYAPQAKRNNIRAFLGNKNFGLVEADIRNKNSIDLAFAKNRPETVVHLAARPGVRPSIAEPLIYEDVNIRGTLNILEAVKKHGVKNLLFASSSSVYGRGKAPFVEQQTPDPTSPYSLTKLVGEHYCRLYSSLYGINALCLRYFTVYGPMQRPEMAIHKFTRLIDEGKEVPVYGRGNSERDYTFVDDVVQGTIAAIEKMQERKLGFDVLNIGNSETIKLTDLIALIENELGKKAKVRHMPEQQGDLPMTHADISKARRLIGYAPKTKIKEGIKKFVFWHRGGRGHG